ncbi:hypothetical protein Ssi02_54700 [Sinosporangium siamense]|uniref:Uncharacterized protein n=1 Tax=Sinosporangium siamense TaxID=1367973 RepID=A0A919VEL3_9ACTN|nr:hypothetical protein Ssi02_54700 [Sinosporangium siamense]
MTAAPVQEYHGVADTEGDDPGAHTGSVNEPDLRPEQPSPQARRRGGGRDTGSPCHRTPPKVAAALPSPATLTEISGFTGRRSAATASPRTGS